MSVRTVAYSYKNLKDLQAHKDEALARFWQEIEQLAALRKSRFVELKCKTCGADLNLFRPFFDAQYIDTCKKCDCLNRFVFEDVFYLDEFVSDDLDDAKEEILEAAWENALLHVETRLPEACTCNQKLDWFCMYEEENQFAAKCVCGKGYYQQKF